MAARNRRLSTLLAGGIISVVILAFAIFSLGAYRLVLEPLQAQRAHAEVRRAADQVGASMASLIGSTERVLQTAAVWGQNGAYGFDDPARAVRLFRPIMEYRRAINSVLLADDAGHEIRLDRGADAKWKSRVVDLPASPDRHMIAIWNGQGEKLDEEANYDAYDPKLEDWYALGMAAQRDLDVDWGPPLVLDDGFVGMQAIARFKVGRGPAPRFLVFNTSLIDLTRLTKSTHVGERGRVSILTEDGRLLAVPETPDLSTAEEIRAVLLRPAQEAGLQATARAFENWRSGSVEDGAAVVFEAYGSRWSGAVREAKMGSRRVVIVATAPVADFALVSPRAAGVGAALLGGVLLAALVAAMLFAGRITGGVRRLVAESARIGRLELTAPVNLKTPALELDQLVEAQEQMRGRLLEATRDLETRIAARTKEITERGEAMARLSEAAAARAEREETLGQFARDLGGDRPVGEVAELALARVAARLGAAMGAVYLLGADRRLRRVGAIAYPPNTPSERPIDIGSGVVGQAVKDGRIATLDGSRLAQGTEFGFSEVVPPHALVMPLRHQEKSIGAMEFAAFAAFTPAQLDWAASAADAVATALRFAQEGERRHRAAKRTAALVNAAPYAMVITDATGRIVEVNRLGETLLGVERGAAIGKSFATLLPERHRAEVSGADWNGSAAGGVRELSILGPAGREFPAELRPSPIEADDGTFIAIVIRDITTRRAVEAEAKKAHEEADIAKAARSRLATALHGGIRDAHGAMTAALENLAKTRLSSEQKTLAQDMAKSLERAREAAEVALRAAPPPADKG